MYPLPGLNAHLADMCVDWLCGFPDLEQTPSDRMWQLGCMKGAAGVTSTIQFQKRTLPFALPQNGQSEVLGLAMYCLCLPYFGVLILALV